MSMVRRPSSLWGRKSEEMPSLTPRQQEILAYVKDYVEAHGFAPTYEEIGSFFGICKVTVLAHVKQLAKKGLIRHVPYAARGIEICCGGSTSAIPIAGVIQAGHPILAVEDAEKADLMDLVPLGPDLFALRVKGDSMVGDHIQDGDYVIVQRPVTGATGTATARPGEVVVALVDNEEATLKRFYPHGENVRLEPANPAFEPLVVRWDRVRIQGTVVGVLRLFT